MNIPDLRYKAFRLFKRLALGPVGGGALGRCVCRSLAEGRADPTIGAHIADSRMIAPACVQSYPFPDGTPPEFPRDAAFDSKILYRLRNVVVSPSSGLIWLPGGPILQESAGSLPRIFAERVKDTLCRVSTLKESCPVIPFPSLEYYHAIFDTLANVLHALSFAPNAKLLLSCHRPNYVDGILDFLGIPDMNRLEENDPVLVKDLVFSPTWVNGGFVPPVDLDVLRRTILPRIGKTKTSSQLLYISRAKTRNRPISNEREIEGFLENKGFSIRYFETISFEEQLNLVANARMIVAPHGAGLANLFAVTPGTQIVEFLSRDWFNTCYAKLAIQIGCHYRFLESVPIPRTSNDQSVRRMISIDELGKILEGTVA